MDESKNLQWLIENLRDARMALTSAELVLKHAAKHGERIADLLGIVEAHTRGIRGLECLLESRIRSEDSSRPIRTPDG